MDKLQGLIEEILEGVEFGKIPEATVRTDLYVIGHYLVQVHLVQDFGIGRGNVYSRYMGALNNCIIPKYRRDATPQGSIIFKKFGELKGLIAKRFKPADATATQAAPQQPNHKTWEEEPKKKEPKQSSDTTRPLVEGVLYADLSKEEKELYLMELLDKPQSAKLKAEVLSFAKELNLEVDKSKSSHKIIEQLIDKI